MERLLDTYHFRDAQKEAMNLARIGNKYLADTEPWKLAKTDMARVAHDHEPRFADHGKFGNRFRTIPAVQHGEIEQDAECGTVRLEPLGID